jgi:hypothetical protein
MTLTVIAKDHLRHIEMLDKLKEATELVEECDNILIIMQKKQGGMQWFAPDSARIETASFMALGFLHYLHSLKPED